MTGGRVSDHGGVTAFVRKPAGTEDVDRTPVLLLHGLGNSAAFWEPVADLLPDACVLLAPDIPGFGDSDTPSEWSLDGLVQPLIRVMREVHPGPWLIVGHSFGGLVALDIAARQSELVSKLILVDAHLLTAARVIRRPLRTRAPMSLRLALLAQVVGGILPSAGFGGRWASRSRIWRRWIWRPFMATPVSVEPGRLASALRRNRGGIGTVRALRLARSLDVPGIMAAVTAPVMVVYGADDLLLSADDHNDVIDALHVTALERLDGCGHWPILEQPENVAVLIY